MCQSGGPFSGPHRETTQRLKAILCLNLWSCIRKELTLLYRDFSGLMVLFVMPVALVIVVTLVQENVLKSMGETKTRMLFIDLDGKTARSADRRLLKEIRCR